MKLFIYPKQIKSIRLYKPASAGFLFEFKKIKNMDKPALAGFLIRIRHTPPIRVSIATPFALLK